MYFNKKTLKQIQIFKDLVIAQVFFIIKKSKVDHYSNLLPEFHDFEYQKKKVISRSRKKEKKLREIINLIAKIIKEGEMSIKRERIIFHPEFLNKLKNLQLR